MTNPWSNFSTHSIRSLLGTEYQGSDTPRRGCSRSELYVVLSCGRATITTTARLGFSLTIEFDDILAVEEAPLAKLPPLPTWGVPVAGLLIKPR